MFNSFQYNNPNLPKGPGNQPQGTFPGQPGHIVNNQTPYYQPEKFNPPSPTFQGVTNYVHKRK